jgi:hypothetical protein
LITYHPESFDERPEAVIQPTPAAAVTTPMSHFSNHACARCPKMKSVAPSM